MSFIIAIFLFIGFCMVHLEEKGREVQTIQKLDEREAFKQRFRNTMINQNIENQVNDLIDNNRDAVIKELGEIFSHFSNLAGREKMLENRNTMSLNIKFVKYFLCLNRGYVSKDHENNPMPGYVRGGMSGIDIFWDDKSHEELKAWIESKFLERGYRITYDKTQYDVDWKWIEY